jgi:hypothetical protein
MDSKMFLATALLAFHLIEGIFGIPQFDGLK